MTAEMITKVSTIATRWTKNGMDRLYINIDAANELYTSIDDRAHGQLTMNRRERSTGKIWIEVESGEICTKGISDSDEVVSEIEEIIAYLCPVEETAETETTETESTETTETKSTESTETESTETKLWYALQRDTEDDWSTGSYNRDEAIRQLIDSNGFYTLIAVIDGQECVDEIWAEAV